MNGQTRQCGQILILLGLTALAGCQGMFGSQGVPTDPLLVSRKPLEVEAKVAPPVEVAYAEPAIPPHPDLAKSPSAIVEKKKSPSPSPEPSERPVPGTLTNRPSQRK